MLTGSATCIYMFAGSKMQPGLLNEPLGTFVLLYCKNAPTELEFRASTITCPLRGS